MYQTRDITSVASLPSFLNPLLHVLNLSWLFTLAICINLLEIHAQHITQRVRLTFTFLGRTFSLIFIPRTFTVPSDSLQSQVEVNLYLCKTFHSSSTSSAVFPLPSFQPIRRQIRLLSSPVFRPAIRFLSSVSTSSCQLVVANTIGAPEYSRYLILVSALSSKIRIFWVSSSHRSCSTTPVDIIHNQTQLREV